MASSLASALGPVLGFTLFQRYHFPGVFLGTGAAQPALLTLAVDQSSADRRGQSLAQIQFFYDLGIGVGSLTLGALLDWVEQSFLIMYLATAAVALIGLWINWRRK